MNRSQTSENNSIDIVNTINYKDDIFYVNFKNISTWRRYWTLNLNNRSWGLFWPRRNKTRHYFLIGWTYSFVFHNILTNTEDIWNVMTHFHCITWYAHQTLMYATGKMWPKLPPLFQIFRFWFFFLLCKWKKWVFSKQRKRWFIYENRFIFDEMVVILLFS